MRAVEARGRNRPRLRGPNQRGGGKKAGVGAGHPSVKDVAGDLGLKKKKKNDVAFFSCGESIVAWSNVVDVAGSILKFVRWQILLCQSDLCRLLGCSCCWVSPASPRFSSSSAEASGKLPPQVVGSSSSSTALLYASAAVTGVGVGGGNDGSKAMEGHEMGTTDHPYKPSPSLSPLSIPLRQTSLPRVIRGLVQSSSSENGFGVRVYLPAAIKDLAQLVVASFSS